MGSFAEDLAAAQLTISSLNEQIRMLRALSDGLDQGLVTTDSTQKVTFANQFAQRLFGSELVGSLVRDLQGALASSSGGEGEVALRGEVLVLDRTHHRETRCFLDVAPLSRQDESDRTLVWSFFELTAEWVSSAAFADFSAEQKALTQLLKRKEEEIVRLTKFDRQTGILNRASILSILEKAQSFGQSQGADLSVGLLSVDQISRVNEQLGWRAGDDLLRRVCALVAELLGRDGTLGRLNGNEFLAVIPGADREQSRILAEKLVVAVRRSRPVLGSDVTITVGVAEFRPGVSVEALVSQALSALAQGKAAGRDRVVVSP